MPADCQIHSCGVLAVGRCLECNRAFCASHQAYSPDRVRLTDQCSACQRDKKSRAAQASQAKWQDFLEAVRACETQPFPRLLAGAVLKARIHPPQRIPWCLYDPKLETASFSDRDLCARIAHDFVDEAWRRGVQPEERVRSRRSVKKGFLQRVHVEAIHDQAWLIPGGSNRWSGGKSEGRLGAIIWADGEIGADHPADNSWGGLHEGSLATMAEILGINTTPRGR